MEGEGVMMGLEGGLASHLRIRTPDQPDPAITKCSQEKEGKVCPSDFLGRTCLFAQIIRAGRDEK